MSKLFLILCLIALCFTALQASFLSATIYPSATDVAFGNNSGTANIWNRNPLDVMSNPAKLGYFNGISYGYSDDAWFDEVEGLEDKHYLNSYVAIGWEGIGILLPVTGGEFRYGKQDMLDEEGQNLGTFKDRDIIDYYAIGVNCLEVLNNMTSSQSIKNLSDRCEISLGYSYVDLKMDFYDYHFNDQVEHQYFPEIDGNTSVLGLTFLYKPIVPQLDNKGFGWDLVAAYSNYNPFKSKAGYYKPAIDNSFGYLHEEEITRHYNVGISTRFAVNSPAGGLKKLGPHPINNLFSVYLSYDYSEELNYSKEGESGYGAEFTLLELISLRKGRFDGYGGVEGDCWGVGVNFSINDYAKLQFNYADFAGGELQKHEDRTDYMINIDVLKIAEGLRK